jgi:ribosomal silencing factor RsfS
LKDAVHFHRACRGAGAFGEQLYPRFKTWCDEYFFLKHRNEQRGMGGIFFDDFPSWARSRALPCCARWAMPFWGLPAHRGAPPGHAHGAQQVDFQRYRRGRYVEFNLVWDRGTHFGLQSGGRTESILLSMPPHAGWSYQRDRARQSMRWRMNSWSAGTGFDLPATLLLPENYNFDSCQSVMDWRIPSKPLSRMVGVARTTPWHVRRCRAILIERNHIPSPDDHLHPIGFRSQADVTKLQRAIVDGLEDVKAHDIQVFNTEHLSPLFERVIVASGTSNRQTKALASSVREAVKKPVSRAPPGRRDNGEWIIVDCGRWCTSCSRPSASTTAWKKSGARSRCA